MTHGGGWGLVEDADRGERGAGMRGLRVRVRKRRARCGTDALAKVRQRMHLAREERKQRQRTRSRRVGRGLQPQVRVLRGKEQPRSNKVLVRLKRSPQL